MKLTESMRRYWLDRYTVDQIIELASGLFIALDCFPRRTAYDRLYGQGNA